MTFVYIHFFLKANMKEFEDVDILTPTEEPPACNGNGDYADADDDIGDEYLPDLEDQEDH